MTSASKFFAKAVATMTCADLVHADRRSCCEAAVWNFTQTFAGCCRYVLPIAIVRIRMSDLLALQISPAYYLNPPKVAGVAESAAP